MSEIELFDMYFNDYISVLKNNTSGILSTVGDTSFPSSRTMFFLKKEDVEPLIEGHLYEDGCFYIITSKNTLKYLEIEKNNSVTFSILNQADINGYAKKVDFKHGKGMAEAKYFYQLLKTNFLRYTEDDDLVLYKIDPILVKMWSTKTNRDSSERVFIYPKTKLMNREVKK